MNKTKINKSVKEAVVAVPLSIEIETKRRNIEKYEKNTDFKSKNKKD